MPPQRPEEWPGQFTQALNAGDLDAVIELYDPAAHFVALSGETVVGHEAIRAVIAGLIDTKTQLRSHVVKVVTLDDIAVLYTDFDGTRLDSTQQTTPMHSQALEILRRQDDGTWRLIVGDPNARG